VIIEKPMIVVSLATIGIVASPIELLTGFFFAMSGAYLASYWNPERDPRELKQILFAAVFVVAVIAVLYRSIDFLSQFPIVAVMAIGGFLSRYIVGFGLNFGSAGETKGGVAVDAVLPDKTKDTSDHE